MTSQRPSRHVVIGVDTHKATHHVAVIDADTAKLLGDNEFPATAAGYRKLLAGSSPWASWSKPVLKELVPTARVCTDSSALRALPPSRFLAPTAKTAESEASQIRSTRSTQPEPSWLRLPRAHRKNVMDSSKQCE